MKHPRHILLLIAFIYTVTNANATDHSGVISSNQTWTKSASPHIVTGSISVNAGVTLTIQAGATVKFNNNTGLTINGTLIARGTQNDMITFTSNDVSPAKDDWYNIKFNESSVDALYGVDINYLSGSILEYCIIEYAGAGSSNGAVQTYQAQPGIWHCEIRENGCCGIYAEQIYPDDPANRVKFYYNNIYNNNNGGIWAEVYSFNCLVDIAANSVVNNTGKGIHCTKWNVIQTTDYVSYNIVMNRVYNNTSNGIHVEYAQPAVYYNDCSYNNGYGIYFYWTYVKPTGSLLFLLNTASFNNNGILVSYAGSNIQFSGNTIINNSGYGIKNATGNAVNADNNYWGTTSGSAISAAIYDFNDDPSLGVISYGSAKTSSDPAATPHTTDMYKKQQKGNNVYLRWNAADVSDISGYKIYYGSEESYKYANSVKVGNVTSYTISNASVDDNFYISTYDTDFEGGSDVGVSHESSLRKAEKGLYLTYTKADVSCKNGDNGSINLSAFSGFTPYSYDWSNSATTQDISNLTAGTYSVTVTDAQGFTADATIEITEPLLLEISLLGTDINCSGGNDGEVDLTISGGTLAYYKSWTGPDEYVSSSEDILGLYEGKYIVTVSDSKGCQAKDSVTLTYVHELPTPVIIFADSNKICDGDSLMLDAGAEYTGYIWSNGDITQTTWVKIAGNYDVTVTDVNNCQNTDSEELIVHAIPTSSFTASDAVCGTATAILTYTGTATAFASYNWMLDGGSIITGSGQGPVELNWASTGDKTVSLAVMENGCTSDTSNNLVHVYQVPTSGFTLPDAICDSNQVLICYAGNASAGGSYWWDLNGGTVIAGSGQGPILAKWTTDGVKKVRLAIEENNCYSDTTDQFIDASYPYQNQKICLVTVDLETGKNMVVWENTRNEGIDYYKIYREADVTNVYEPIGELQVEEYSQFVDLDSKPEEQQHLYKISVVDTCGNESKLSDYHKTLFLQYVSSVGGVNLRWDKYEIEGSVIEFNSYIIYRGIDSTALDSVKTLSGSLNSWTDQYSDVLKYRYYYRIAGVKGDLCSPSGQSGLKAGTGPYSHSMSNLEDNRLQLVPNRAPTDIALDNMSINENLPVQTLIGRFTTTDPDPQDSHTYAFISGAGDMDNSHFLITGDSLLCGEMFDYETKNIFSIRVSATDLGSLSFEKQITISINDVSDPVANQSPTDISLNMSTIDENEPSGSLLGRLTTTDPDAGDTHTYSLVTGTGDDDNSDFTISSDSLLTAVIFDYEIRNSFSIRIKTTDNGTGNLYFDKQFIITINDLVETGLADPLQYAVHIYPNPFSHTVTIEFPNPDGKEYTLFIRDLSGKVVLMAKPVRNEQVILERGNLANGYYIIELRGDKIYRGKLIVE